MSKSNPRVSPELVDACKDVSLEMLERARVVGVLDAWAFIGARGWTNRKDDVTYMCGLLRNDRTVIRWYIGDTAAAARAAAAKAIEAGEV